MKIRWDRFNLYLLLGLALALICGCQTPEGKRKKVASTFHLHQETNPDPMGRTEQVPIYRQQPVMFTVEKTPFLTEADVKAAKVIDVLGGFALSIQFDRRGSLLLEQYTTANRGRHIAIFSQFDNPHEQNLNQGRWLAAPKIQNHITDGLLVFTPDATREEAEQIALGLNNVARKLDTGAEFNF